MIAGPDKPPAKTYPVVETRIGGDEIVTVVHNAASRSIKPRVIVIPDDAILQVVVY